MPLSRPVVLNSLIHSIMKLQNLFQTGIILLLIASNPFAVFAQEGKKINLPY